MQRKYRELLEKREVIRQELAHLDKELGLSEDRMKADEIVRTAKKDPSALCVFDLRLLPFFKLGLERLHLQKDDLVFGKEMETRSDWGEDVWVDWDDEPCFLQMTGLRIQDRPLIEDDREENEQVQDLLKIVSFLDDTGFKLTRTDSGSGSAQTIGLFTKDVALVTSRSTWRQIQKTRQVKN